MKNLTPLLSVVFIWNEKDIICQDIVDKCHNYLSMDKKSPFSRNLNIPVFIRTAFDANDLEPILYQSDNIILFPLVTNGMIAHSEWIDYVEGEAKNTRGARRILVPIGLCQSSSRAFERCLSEIRMIDYEGEEITQDKIIIRILHEIYRWTLCQNSNVIDANCKLFLSHTKYDDIGRDVSISIRDFIHKDGKIGSFFDCKNLVPGREEIDDQIDTGFDKQFFSNIKESTLIAIYSDAYSSRHWCQMEMIHAKENNRPIIIVDVAERYEDRRFPHAANVPCIYVDNNKLTNEKLAEVIIAAMVETIRFNYAEICLKKYMNFGLFGESDVLCLSRPPELANIPQILENGENIPVIAYPDPPMFEEEKIFFDKLKIKTVTPLTARSDFNIEGKKIGISISEIDDASYLKKLGQRSEHLRSLSANLAKNILSYKACLVYGGDFRAGSFAYPMLEEASILKERLSLKGNIITEYVSWPFHEQGGFDDQIACWLGRSNVMGLVRCEKPDELENKSFKDITTLDNDRYAWSVSLTSMRNKMISDCDYRICAGGKYSNYKGKMPGILEEILIALDCRKPLFLIGGFSGMTSIVCETILKKEVDGPLSKAFHEKICGSDFLNTNGVDYDSIVEKLKGIKHDYHGTLGNGLSEEDNIKLFSTPFIDEAIFLILKGFKNLKSSSK